MEQKVLLDGKASGIILLVTVVSRSGISMPIHDEQKAPACKTKTPDVVETDREDGHSGTPLKASSTLKCRHMHPSGTANKTTRCRGPMGRIMTRNRPLEAVV
jgi:hypothetical protein